jgi:RNA polymerase sigma factor (sigma-70 family)
VIRVVVADDHNLVRQGICRILEETGEIQVIGEADNGIDALRLARLLSPDVLILDIAMSPLNGLDTLKQVKTPKNGPQVIMLSMHADHGLVQQALQHGALGYVLKDALAEELQAAVRAVSSSNVYLSSGISQVLSEMINNDQTSSPLDRLSPREREVVQMIVEGLSNREIADRLHNSIKTVEKQRRDAMRKLEVDNLASLIRVCLSLGLDLFADPDL